MGWVFFTGEDVILCGLGGDFSSADCSLLLPPSPLSFSPSFYLPSLAGDGRTTVWRQFLFFFSISKLPMWGRGYNYGIGLCHSFCGRQTQAGTDTSSHTLFPQPQPKWNWIQSSTRWMLNHNTLWYFPPIGDTKLQGQTHSGCWLL